jgi:type IV pilus assembly protein PilA
MKHYRKKGFTLVEIIVVLVILAILAAAAIPTMLGFVEDARGKSEIANARAAYVAAQTIATEKFAVTKGTDEERVTVARVSQLTGISTEEIAAITPTISGGKVTELIYETEDYTVTIVVGGDALIVKK